MNRANVIDVLNRLLTLLYRSLPMYFQGARPWTSPESRQSVDVLTRVADDQRMYAQRIAKAILDEGGRPAAGQFPIEFTGIHDCSLDFLVRRAAEDQRRDLEVIRQCVAALADRPRLQALAEEILGNALGHLETLEEVQAGVMKDER